MSSDVGQAKKSTENGGLDGTARGSAASDGAARISKNSTGQARNSAEEARKSRGSDPRGSTDSAGDKRASQGSGAGAKVSFEGEGEDGAGRKSSAGKRASYPGEMPGEQIDFKSQEMHGEDCSCEDCVCPPEEDEKADEDKSMVAASGEEHMETYPLDEFMRAKAYFQQVSSKSGLSLYDHLSDVIRKFLDERAPNNPVDYLEEVSMNVKRYKFGIKGDDALQDAFHISDGVLSDAQRLYGYFKSFSKWGDDRKKSSVSSDTAPGGSFQNLLRLQYYAEQINIGLSREEMYRVALGIKELSSSRSQIARLRFWGKIFGTQKNYYVVEAELTFGGTDQAMDLWNPKDDDSGNETAGGRASDKGRKELEMSAVQTFSRAKDVVLNHEFLEAYSKTSGLSSSKQAAQLPGKQTRNNSWEGEGAPPQTAVLDDSGDLTKWESYQQELMQNFPQSKILESSQVPAEPDGSGINRRVFYVCNELGNDWAMLPAVTPQQITASRNIRWFLTGNLDSSIKSIPAFPGKEGHYLKTLLVRITAGAMCSPKGYFKSKQDDGELPGEDDDEEDAASARPSRAGNDVVQPVKKYIANMKALTNPNLAAWVHHTSYILVQGRNVWWNPTGAKSKRKSGPSVYGSETEGSSEMEDEDEEDEEIEIPGKEVGPGLFRAVAQDKSGDGSGPWSIMTSSSVFSEYQVVSLRSNVWPGSYAICTSKGKVSNLYFGDGLKFSPISYSPTFSDVSTKEYKSGPELEETQDASIEQEQGWLSKLALKEMEEVEAKFADEDALTTGEDDESEYEY